MAAAAVVGSRCHRDTTMMETGQERLKRSRDEYYHRAPMTR